MLPTNHGNWNPAVGCHFYRRRRKLRDSQWRRDYRLCWLLHGGDDVHLPLVTMIAAASRGGSQVRAPIFRALPVRPSGNLPFSRASFGGRIRLKGYQESAQQWSIATRTPAIACPATEIVKLC